jgi:hypothetical protein
MQKTKRIRKTKGHRKTKGYRKTKGHRKTKRRLLLKRTQKGGNESTETILEDAKKLTESQFMKKYKIIHTAEKQDYNHLMNIYHKKYELDPNLSPNKENYPKIYRDVDMIENIMKDHEVKRDDYIFNLYFIVLLMRIVLIEEFIKIGVLTINENGEIDINERKKDRNTIIRATYTKLTDYLQDLMNEITKRKGSEMESIQPTPVEEAPLEEPLEPPMDPEVFKENYGDE